MYNQSDFVNDQFHQYFLSIYKNRWDQIFQALVKPEKQVLRRNIFAQLPEAQFNNFRSEVFFQSCHLIEEHTNAHTLVDHQDLKLFYKMDPASFIVAKLLDVQKNETILDLCAAPGGKTLILAEMLYGTGKLISNEISAGRRERLTRVLREYLPFDYRKNVFVQGKDGNAYGLQMPEAFDRVLADVPCSGERHLLENSNEFKLWTKKRSQNLAVRQYSLLSSAYLSCKSQGRIIYSTCSISPLENDDVVKKLIKKRSVQILKLEDLAPELAGLSFIEATEYGYQILPDTEGFGPMYFSLVQKI